MLCYYVKIKEVSGIVVASGVQVEHQVLVKRIREGTEGIIYDQSEFRRGRGSINQTFVVRHK